jgi:hypothetical protein
MSEENVEIVRRYLETGLVKMPSDGLLSWIAGFWESDGDYYPVRGFPEARPCHGREEIADFIFGLHDPWNYRVMVKDPRHADYDARSEEGPEPAQKGAIQAPKTVPWSTWLVVAEPATSRGVFRS